MAKTTSAQAEINALIQDFSDRLGTLVRRTTLEQIVNTLTGSSGIATTQKRKRGRPVGSKNAVVSAPAVTATAAQIAAPGVARIAKAPKGHRRTAEDFKKMGETLLAHVKKNPGQRGEQIAKALRTDVNVMRPPMKALIAAKKIKTKGQRRGMTYIAA